MLLRRVTEHVKTQNWFAVGIDLVIVVVGVFIGIQVSNWNAEIEESREAERMRDSILVDLENERIVSTVLREYWVTTRAYAEVAVDGFQGGAAVDDEQFVISAYQASQAQFPLSNRATYEQMVASGNVNIAGSEELRLAIINYYVSNWAQGPDNVTVPPYRANIRRAIPHPIQAAIREDCGDRITDFNSISALVLPKSCDLELPAEAFAEAAAYLRERPDLLMDLRLQLSDLEAKLQNLDQVDIQLEHMLSLAGH